MQPFTNIVPKILVQMSFLSVYVALAQNFNILAGFTPVFSIVCGNQGRKANANLMF